MKHRFSLTAASLLLATLVTAPTWGAAAPPDGARVGQWKTWVLASGSEIAVPAPPAENSDQTRAELAELRALQAARTPAINVVIQYYNGVPATQRWHDQMFLLMNRDRLSPNRQARILALLHTTLHDAVVAAYAAKYQHNRRPPAQVAADLTPLVTVSGETGPAVPSYPSEHAAIAGAAVGVLSTLFPNDADGLKAMAQESGQTRLQMGANYRSDIDAGFALGQAVAVKANARAAADGSAAVWTGTIPTGPGLWTGTNPLEPLQGTWKTWILTSGSQIRPGPPPAFGSAEMNAELTYMKQINSNPSPAQRAIAVDFPATALTRFWNNVYEVVRIERLSVLQETRIASTAAAVWLDSNIAAHDAKYFYWRLRPAQADPTIVPLIPTPNHPSYPSNAAILYTATAEFLSMVLPNHAHRFQALAQEGSYSRIFAGIHYPSDEQASEQMGRQLAAIAFQRYQQDGA